MSGVFPEHRLSTCEYPNCKAEGTRKIGHDGTLVCDRHATWGQSPIAPFPESKHGTGAPLVELRRLHGWPEDLGGSTHWDGCHLHHPECAYILGYRDAGGPE